MTAGILFLAVFADVCVRLSLPGTIDFAGLIAFLALLTSFAILFVRTVEWPAAAALAVGLFGLAPATVRTVPDPNLVASLTGIAAGLAICGWNPDRPWYRWAALIPAIPCMLLHKAGIGFAPLLAASVWFSGRRLIQYWPSLLVSVLAGLLHRGEGFHPAASFAAIPATFAGFFLPWSVSLQAGWSVADGVASFAAVAGTVVATTLVFRLPVVAFGLVWFLVMALVAPSEPMAAFPGLALAVIAALAPLAEPLREANLSWP